MGPQQGWIPAKSEQEGSWHACSLPLPGRALPLQGTLGQDGTLQASPETRLGLSRKCLQGLAADRAGPGGLLFASAPRVATAQAFRETEAAVPAQAEHLIDAY